MYIMEIKRVNSHFLLLKDGDEIKAKSLKSLCQTVFDDFPDVAEHHVLAFQKGRQNGISFINLSPEDEEAFSLMLYGIFCKENDCTGDFQ